MKTLRKLACLVPALLLGGCFTLPVSEETDLVGHDSRIYHTVDYLGVNFTYYGYNGSSVPVCMRVSHVSGGVMNYSNRGGSTPVAPGETKQLMFVTWREEDPAPWRTYSQIQRPASQGYCDWSD